MFTGKKSAIEVKDWLEEFQQTVNKSAGNQHLKLAAEIWTTEDNPPTPTNEERVPIVTNE